MRVTYTVLKSITVPHFKASGGYAHALDMDFLRREFYPITEIEGSRRRARKTNALLQLLLGDHLCITYPDRSRIGQKQGDTV